MYKSRANDDLQVDGNREMFGYRMRVVCFLRVQMEFFGRGMPAPWRVPQRIRAKQVRLALRILAISTHVG
jgi:hypothetical protein